MSTEETTAAENEKKAATRKLTVKKKTVSSESAAHTTERTSGADVPENKESSGTHKKKKVSSNPDAPKKKKVSSGSDAPRKKKVSSEPDAPRKKKVSSELDAPKKKKVSSEPDAPRKKKVSSEPDAPKKKKVSSGSDAPRKKNVSSEPDAPKKKKVSSDPNAPRKKKKKKKVYSETETAVTKHADTEVSETDSPEKKKIRLKRNAKIAVAALCVAGVFCGILAFKNASRSSAEVENVPEVTETETVPETTEEPTTEPTTEEPTENPNAPFIDYDYPIDPSKPMIALTYDDGPASSTNTILDTLEANHAHATFFVVGENVTPDSEPILRREVELGCEVANHSWDHESLRDCKLETALESLKKCDDAIFNAIGRYPQHVRPPYGEYSDELLAEDGRIFIYWSLDTNDWKYRDAEKDYEVLMDNLDDGDIILMHDIHPESAEASTKLIPDLIAQGYQLVTVSELMYYRNCPQEPGMLLFDVHPDAPYYILDGVYHDEPVTQDVSEEETGETGESGSEGESESTEETTETASSETSE